VASMTIRNLDENIKERLRIRAAERGSSMEEEAREILREALSQEEVVTGGLAQRIHRRFAQIGGVDLPLPERQPGREPPELGL